MQATITSKGQITLPKAVRDRLNLKAGDKLDFLLDDNGNLLLLSRPSGSNLPNSSRLTRIDASDGSAIELALIPSYAEGMSRMNQTLYLATARSEVQPNFVGEVLALDLASSATTSVAAGNFLDDAIPVGLVLGSGSSLITANTKEAIEIDIVTGNQLLVFTASSSAYYSQLGNWFDEANEDWLVAENRRLHGDEEDTYEEL